MKNVQRKLLLLILVCSPAFSQSLSVIELKYRRADELIPVIQPLLDAGERITGKDYELYLVAGPNTEQRIRDLVARLDKQPVQLLISVRTPQDSDNERSDLSAQGRLANGQVQIGTGTGTATRHDGFSINAEDSTVTHTRRQTPQIRATEGEPALIQAGLSVPIRTTERHYQNGHLVEREQVEYRPVTAGFYVTAYVHGDAVRLEIRQQDDSLSTGGAINIHRLTTSAHGKLGDWISLGGINTEETRSNSGLLSRQTTHTRRDNAVMIKVDKIPARN